MSTLINPEELARFLERADKSALKLLSALGKLDKDLSVIFGNDLGKKLLDEDFNRMEELWPKVYREKATPDEIEEFRYLRDKRIPHIVSMVKRYLDGMVKVKKLANI